MENTPDKEQKQIPMAPTTTAQEDMVTAGQRAINLIWEKTQSQIAKVTVYTALSVNALVIILLIIYRKEVSTTMLVVVLASLGSMNTTMGIIIGFYFSRTNHSAVGGVGKKVSQSNKGQR